MATRYLEKFDTFTTTAPGVGQNLPKAAPIGYDKTADQLKFIDDDGAIHTVQAPLAPETLASGSKTITPAMAGKTWIATEAAVQTFTLPTAASMPGARQTFICGNAGGEILVTPNAADQISAKGLVDHSTSVKPAAGTGIKNTAATNVLGDHITLVSDGVLTWHEVSGAGIWASQ